MKKIILTFATLFVLTSCSKDSKDETSPTPAPIVTSIQSQGVGFTGNGGVYDRTFKISYTGGNGLDYPEGKPIASTGITGFTLTLQPGKLSNGTGGDLIFKFKGTATSVGVAYFDISFGGQTSKTNVSVTIPAKITSLSCDLPTFSAVPKAGTAFTGTLTVPHTGGNGGSFEGEEFDVINSTGVKGLTAAIQGSQIQLGNGLLTFKITGTPSGSGTATFPITFDRQSCSISTTVNP
jgi:trimeric autotransporter adhesin